MARSHRQDQILALLKARGKAAITFLAEEFDVSDETIRRDLKSLSGDGLVEKFHGGVRLSMPRSEPPFERRLSENAAAKAAIAARTASHIREGATLLLDNSTTACFLARELTRREPMTILTISLEIAQILNAGGGQHRVILPGGELRKADRTLTGAGTISYLSGFSPSYFVMSVVAGSARGCQDFDLFEVEFKRAMIARADETILMMDHGKFSKSGLIHVCDWSDVDVLVTDGAPPEIAEQIDHGHLLLTGDPAEPLAGDRT
ncbi:DeoR/GlpR family DNA-binding transcription regulator [Pseudodonghicola flavimaris]|uniref:DeoR/GlpR family DNA-binding transcription regulator n=1 Tax=Pseudodonghicola flavimaris TaxID=3050036 RepID=A0ABT7EVV9_9RHOB|nr:DeoR/GlpR family DNA-binding transcription regulator [Pseudodonghicola flavimaris]MDK3016479.1 DeoR/GlpR family DNA-binding transcription regulator [Pseudodonghicola flavimaris]